MQAAQMERALGCWLGQLSGDALGSMTEGLSPAEIQERWPDGLEQMNGSPRWHTAPGQPTDDSEMAMELAYSLQESYPHFDINVIAFHYRNWMESDPFSCGHSIAKALTGHFSVGLSSLASSIERQANQESQANGALMRQSPLGIWGYGIERSRLAEAARQDARLTHPHGVCQEASAVYVTTLAEIIAQGLTPKAAYQYALDFQNQEGTEPSVRECLLAAQEPSLCTPPFSPHSGHVLVALHNAFYQLLYAADLQSVIVETAQLGGDTDTNAAIAGALAGAVHGKGNIPADWIRAIEECRPDAAEDARRPRPERYWPGGYQELVRGLVGLMATPRRPY